MATNPAYSPYKTQRFSFIGSPQQRDGTDTKDQRFVNMYPELIKSPISDGKKYYLKKRPGTSAAFTLPVGNSQGLFYWDVNDTYYSAVGGVLYAGITSIVSLSNSVSEVGFCVFQTDNLLCLFVCDGAHAWIVSSTNVVTAVTSGDFPSPHVPAPIFLDGYIFLARPGTQQIVNSMLADPLTWPTDGFIDAEMFPDSIVWLTKAQNYLVAIGTESIEFFYDNANATGSPLQRNAPAVAQIGCPGRLTVVQTEKEVIMVGSTGNGGRTVWSIDGFQPTEIATEPIREALDLEDSGITNAHAACIQISGHKFYVLTLELSSRTFVYDFEEQMWHEWTSGPNQLRFDWKWFADGGHGHPLMLGYFGGTLANLTASVFTDIGSSSNPAGGLINCMAITSKVDFDTIKRKRIYRLSLVGDSPNGTASTPVQVSWSDDDYNSFTDPKILPLNGNYPTITQLGYTRRRAWKFVYQEPFALRLESFEVDLIQEERR